MDIVLAHPNARKGPNRAERRYATELDLRMAAGEVLWFAFEPMRLQLAYRCTYTPDYGVLLPAGEATSMELHECKVMWRGKRGAPDRKGIREDAMIKLRTAANVYPMFSYVLAMEELDRTWTLEPVGPDAMGPLHDIEVRRERLRS